MSDVVQSAVIDYFNTQNAAGVYNSGKAVSVQHTDDNKNERAEGGIGPYVRTFITEIDWDKIDAKRKVVGGTATHSSFENGQFICQINAQVGTGTKSLRIQQKVADAIKKDFVQLNLPTSNIFFIRFGESTSRPPFKIDKESRRGEFQWYRLDLIINYAYSESYT